MLNVQPGVKRLNEPLIGAHLATTTAFDTELLIDRYTDRPGYFFSTAHESTWRPLLARLIRRRIAAQAGREIALVKEPLGSEVAPLIFRTLPRSRLLFLLRDGRDVVDSVLATVESRVWTDHDPTPLDPARRLSVIETAARQWVQRTRAVHSVYDTLPDRQRLLVCYEQLLADTSAEFARVLRWLGLPEDLSLVERFAFDRVAVRGPTHFARAATPGLWRSNLTDDEIEVVMNQAGPTLREFGYS
jgi:hypothetical protein